jgi:hypothetical protein
VPGHQTAALSQSPRQALLTATSSGDATTQKLTPIAESACMVIASVAPRAACRTPGSVCVLIVDLGHGSHLDALRVL